MDSNYRSRGGGGGHGHGPGRQMGRGGRGPIPKADRATYDGKSKRPMIVRKAVDFQSDAITYVVNRVFKESAREYPTVQPSDAFVKSMLPPVALGDQPTSSITGRYIHKAHNKIPHPTFSLAWTLDGRRLFTGNSAGEITMWDGKTFNFVSLVSTGRNEAVRALAWTHSGNFLLTGDGGGYVGYYEPTLKPLYAMQSHRKAIRGLSFAPTDTKFVSCSDDSTLAIWDFATRKSETVLEGHNWDVRAVDWHPYNSLIVSGAKDKLIKLWDGKSKSNIHTWQGHKGDVTKVEWNQNGNWFLSSSRDYSMRIFDIRMMKELQVIRGNGEMCSIAWHPYHEKLFVSGDANGDISFWLAGQDLIQGRLFSAHFSAIWDLKWHPFGHILCASGNDCYTSFWCRNRPGEKMEDRYNDPHYTAPPSKAELEAQQAAAAAAASSNDKDSTGLPMQSSSDDISSSQKHLILPGAVGLAAHFDYSSFLSSIPSAFDSSSSDNSKISSSRMDSSSFYPNNTPSSMNGLNNHPGSNIIKSSSFSPIPLPTLSSSNPSLNSSSNSNLPGPFGNQPSSSFLNKSQLMTSKKSLASAMNIPGLGQLSSGSPSLRGFTSSSTPSNVGSSSSSSSFGGSQSRSQYQQRYTGREDRSTGGGRDDRFGGDSSGRHDRGMTSGRGDRDYSSSGGGGGRDNFGSNSAPYRGPGGDHQRSSSSYHDGNNDGDGDGYQRRGGGQGGGHRGQDFVRGPSGPSGPSSGPSSSPHSMQGVSPMPPTSYPYGQGDKGGPPTSYQGNQGFQPNQPPQYPPSSGPSLNQMMQPHGYPPQGGPPGPQFQHAPQNHSHNFPSPPPMGYGMPPPQFQQGPPRPYQSGYPPQGQSRFGPGGR